ncbi:MAG: beta-lactamase family protein, partial [Gammaproteobacteria bacterium]|nr:beta-lactamase family protein [Gammaproteobacteria bacterium]
GIFGDDTPVDRMYVDQTIGNYDETLQVLIDELAATPLLYQPGTRWVYSVAVDVQGYLIEKWTGKTAGEYLQEKLFEPLGMDQTMAWVPPEDARLLANVYTHDKDGNRAVFDGNLASNHFRQPGGFSGGGQLISTADDYWRFSQMLLNGGEFDGVRYLSPRTVDMMRDHRLPAGVSLSADGSTGFGLNFGVITDASGIDYPASDGEYFWGGLASTVFWIDPKEELIVVMLTQYLPFNSPYYRDLMHRMVHAAIIE